MAVQSAQPVFEGLSGPACCPAAGVALDASEVSGAGSGPVDLPNADPSAFVRDNADGDLSLHLMVENLHCAACIRTIESALLNMDGVVQARVNMSTRRLRVSWRGERTYGLRIMRRVAGLGYPVAPYDPDSLKKADERQNKNLLAALAVAGFAAANVMLLSVAVWAGAFSEMNVATRDLFHWVSALIALPAVAYAGQPFFQSAVAALKQRRLNMDVPISLAVVLAAGMSLHQTINSGDHAYFDASVTLLFFLLIGRYLDNSARSRARSTAEHLLTLNSQPATVLDPDGRERALPAAQLSPSMIIIAAAGERIAADGVIRSGRSMTDTALVSGESVPQKAEPGAAVYAGTVNIDAPLTVEVTACAEDTLLAEIVRLVEAAEQGRAKYVRLAERAARIYAPVVHLLAVLTFIGWMLFTTVGWEPSLMAAVAVLIITCPCALGLAVPAVQVVASGVLLRAGVLVKAADGLERIARCNYVVFDKTGTLSRGEPQLMSPDELLPRQYEFALCLARHSRHPLSRALLRARPASAHLVAGDIEEVPGRGMKAVVNGVDVYLGNRSHCGLGEKDANQQDTLLELWLRIDREPPVRMTFSDALRDDASETVAGLKKLGLGVEILSGDREQPVSAAAREAGIGKWTSQCLPADKVRRLEELKRQGHVVLMVGDGLNDAPALASGFASISPTTAPDISQTAADLVFRGASFMPVLTAVKVARAATRLVKQNFGLAVLYNLIAIPLAVAGWATPLVAAAAMSFSSIAVTLNAMRLRLLHRG